MFLQRASQKSSTTLLNVCVSCILLSFCTVWVNDTRLNRNCTIMVKSQLWCAYPADFRKSLLDPNIHNLYNDLLYTILYDCIYIDWCGKLLIEAHLTRWAQALERRKGVCPRRPAKRTEGGGRERWGTPYTWGRSATWGGRGRKAIQRGGLVHATTCTRDTVYWPLHRMSWLHERWEYVAFLAEGGRNSSWIIHFLTTRALYMYAWCTCTCTSRAIKMRWSTYLTKKCIVTRGLKSSISSSVVEENNDTLQWRKGYEFTRSVALNSGSVRLQWDLSNLDTLGTEESVLTSEVSWFQGL